MILNGKGSSNQFWFTSVQSCFLLFKHANPIELAFLCVSQMRGGEGPEFKHVLLILGVHYTCQLMPYMFIFLTVAMYTALYVTQMTQCTKFTFFIFFSSYHMLLLLLAVPMQRQPWLPSRLHRRTPPTKQLLFPLELVAVFKEWAFHTPIS